MTDGEAMARSAAVKGEPVADRPGPLARLYADIAPELRRFVLGVVRDPELTDDVMQATFVKVIEQGHQPRPETARGWLFQVALHEALAVRRRASVHDRSLQRLAGRQPRPAISPGDRLLQGETVEAVRKALDQVSDEQRTVILARMYEDKTFAEIAGELGLPLGTVLTRMRRGLEKMRTFLSPGG